HLPARRVRPGLRRRAAAAPARVLAAVRRRGAVRRRLLLGAAAVLVILLGLAAAYVLRIRHEGRDIRGPPTREVGPAAVPKPPPPPKKGAPVGIVWPTYGRDPERLRVATGISLAPPFRRLWMFRAGSLVEFPPAVAYGNLYFANNDGDLFSVV